MSNLVVREELFDEYSEFQEPLAAWAARMAALLAKVPEEFRESSFFRFYEGDECGGNISVFYTRPLTAEEAAEKEREHRAYLQEQEARERAQYARLAIKYGTHKPA